MKILDLSKPQAGLKSAQLQYNILSYSVLSLTYEGRCPFVHKEKVRVLLKKTVLLEGMVLMGATSCSGATQSISLQIVDDFYLLDKTPFIGYVDEEGEKITKNPYLAVVNGYNPRMWAGDPTDYGQGGIVEIKRALKGILNTALINKVIDVDIVLDVDEKAQMVPFMVASSTYGDLVRSILKWRPNTASYFDYSGAKPALHITEHSLLETRTIDIKELEVASLDLTPRYDLSPSAICLTCTQQNKWGGYVSADSIVPENANIHTHDTLAVGFDGDATGRILDPKVEEAKEEDEKEPDITPSPAYQAPRKDYMVVKGLPLPKKDNPVVSRAFWLRQIPLWEKIKDKLDFGACEITGLDYDAGEGASDEEEKAPKNWDTTATGYEHLEGSFNEKTHLKHCLTRVVQYVRYKGVKVPPDYSLYFPFMRDDGSWYGKFAITVRTISKRKHFFLLNKEQTDLSDEDVRRLEEPTEEEKEEEEYRVNNSPPDSLFKTYYQEAAKAFYEATRHVPFDGTLPLKGLYLKRMIGTKVNVLGLNPAWERMESVVNSVSLDMIAKTTTLSLGAPEYLAVADMASLAKSLREQADSTKMAQMTPLSEEEEKTPSPEKRPIPWTSRPNPYPKERPDKKAKAPEFTPQKSGISQAAWKYQPSDDFSLASYVDEEGNVVATYVQNGRISIPSNGTDMNTGLKTNEMGYVFVGNGACPVYLLFCTDRDGVILRESITFSALPGIDSPYRYWDEKTTPRPSNHPVGYYSIEIGKIENGGIPKQAQLGRVVLSYAPVNTYYPPPSA